MTTNPPNGNTPTKITPTAPGCGLNQTRICCKESDTRQIYGRNEVDRST